jgi:two-component system, OmpR family, response regulator
MTRRRKQDRALSQFVHDLRNCLAPMRNALTLLERTDEETLAYARGLLRKQLDALEGLTESLVPTLKSEHTEHEPAHGRRILIADDNREWVDSLAMVLQSEGYTVFTAYGGREAIESAESTRPDVVILDIEMPEMSGYEVARQLRRRFAEHTPLLIALTVWAGEADRRLSKRAGFDHHVAKPMRFAELSGILAAETRAAS